MPKEHKKHDSSNVSGDLNKLLLLISFFFCILKHLQTCLPVQTVRVLHNTFPDVYIKYYFFIKTPFLLSQLYIHVSNFVIRLLSVAKPLHSVTFLQKLRCKIHCENVILLPISHCRREIGRKKSIDRPVKCTFDVAIREWKMCPRIQGYLINC